MAGAATGGVTTGGSLVMTGSGAGALVTAGAITSALVAAASATSVAVLVGWGVSDGLSGGLLFFPQLKFNESRHARAAVIETGTVIFVIFMWQMFLRLKRIGL